MGVILGIDLGTTYSCMSYVDKDGIVRVIDNIEGEQTTPSVVYFDPDGSAVVGSTAKAEGGMHPECIVERVKNFMGDPDYKCYVNGNEYSAEGVSNLILQKLVSDAEQTLGEEIGGAVITIPGYFGVEAKRSTVYAAQRVVLNNGNNLKIYQVLAEPIAAAIAYCNYCNEDMDKTVLMYDLGGATFDCTVMKITNNSEGLTTRVITVGGNHLLGGKDWDAALTSLVIQKYCAATGCDIDEMKNDVELNAWFSENIEKAKKNLTSRDSTSLTVNYDGKKERIEVTRSEFNEATTELLDQTIFLINDMLEKKGLNMMSDIDEIILVGGSTYMPQVTERLTVEYNKVISSYEPNKAVAMGAALLAATLNTSDDMETISFGHQGNDDKEKSKLTIGDTNFGTIYDVWAEYNYGIILEIGVTEETVILINSGDSLPKKVGCGQKGVDVFYRKTSNDNMVSITVVKCKFENYENEYADIKIKFRKFIADKTPLEIELFVDASVSTNENHELHDKLVVTNKLNKETFETIINWRKRAYVKGSNPTKFNFDF